MKQEKWDGRVVAMIVDFGSERWVLVWRERRKKAEGLTADGSLVYDLL